MSKTGRPTAARDPESARRLSELLERLGKNPGALVRGFDTPGRKHEAQLRDWMRNLRAPIPRPELVGVFTRAGVKAVDEVADFVYEGKRRPSWWADKNDPGLEPEGVVAARPAEPLAADPLMGVLKAALAKRLTLGEARAAIVGLAKSGLLDDDLSGDGHRARGSRCMSGRMRLLLSAASGPRRIVKIDDLRKTPRAPKRRPVRVGTH